MHVYHLYSGGRVRESNGSIVPSEGGRVWESYYWTVPSEGLVKGILEEISPGLVSSILATVLIMFAPEEVLPVVGLEQLVRDMVVHESLLRTLALSPETSTATTPELPMEPSLLRSLPLLPETSSARRKSYSVVSYQIILN